MAGKKDKYVWTVKVGEKGQLVIPKQARELFGIEPGESLLVFGDAKQGLAIPPKNALTGLMAKMFNSGQDEDDR